MIDYCSRKFKSIHQETTANLQQTILNGISTKSKVKIPIKKAKNYFETHSSSIFSKIKAITTEDPHLKILMAIQSSNASQSINMEDIEQYRTKSDQKSLTALKELKIAIVSNVFDYLTLSSFEIEDSITSYLEKLIEFGKQSYIECKSLAVEAKLVFKAFDIDILYVQMLIKHVALLIHLGIEQTASNFVQSEIKRIRIDFRSSRSINPSAIEEKQTLLDQCSKSLESVVNHQKKVIMKSVIKALEKENGRPLVFYECPNGHLYSIGECGMAMQESVCPDCGAAIGGQNHRSLRGNRQIGQGNQVLNQ